ncbi:MAG: hypothetical protein H7318_16735 [Oligoflexus sp.]|nr:hypothetical protein [Oligoflexus sp.]
MLRSIMTPVLVGSLTVLSVVGCTKTKQEARKEGTVDVRDAQKEVHDQQKDVIEAQKDVEKAQQDVEKEKIETQKEVEQAKP